jgi:hypothetical protein
VMSTSNMNVAPHTATSVHQRDDVGGSIDPPLTRCSYVKAGVGAGLVWGVVVFVSVR